jgi:hypothetical protein
MIRPLHAALSAALAASLAAPGVARAGDGDGVYGRFDGDLELRAEAGAAFAAGGPALAAGASVLYISTVGVYGHYTDAVGSEAPRVSRSIAAGVRLAPLFPGRYATNLERGPGWLDLFVDSLAFDLGAFWDLRRGAWTDRGNPGLELALGAAMPFRHRVNGPVLGLRAALRWRAADLTAPEGRGVVDRGAVLSLTLGWRHVVLTHLVDPGDGLVR